MLRKRGVLIARLLFVLVIIFVCIASAGLLIHYWPKAADPSALGTSKAHFVSHRVFEDLWRDYVSVTTIQAVNLSDLQEARTADTAGAQKKYAAKPLIIRAYVGTLKKKSKKGAPTISLSTRKDLDIASEICEFPPALSDEVSSLHTGQPIMVKGVLKDRFSFPDFDAGTFIAATSFITVRPPRSP